MNKAIRGQHRQTLSLSKASEYLSMTDIKGANSFCDPSGPAVSPLANTAPSLTAPPRAETPDPPDLAPHSSLPPTAGLLLLFCLLPSVSPGPQTNSDHLFQHRVWESPSVNPPPFKLSIHPWPPWSGPRAAISNPALL